MQTTELTLTHSLRIPFLRGAVEPAGLRQSLTACADGHETSCYRVIFERMLFFKAFIPIVSLFLVFEEYYNDSFFLFVYLSGTMLLLSTQAMLPP